MNLNFLFKSDNHIRFENGQRISDTKIIANRAIKVEPNINEIEGFTVTIYNLDGDHPIWQNNVQMAAKQMKMIQQLNEKIVLRGYGDDIYGAPFADYGLTIFYKFNSIEKCILHIHNRGIDIEYLPDNKQFNSEPEIVSIAKNVNDQYKLNNITDGRQLLVQIYHSVKRNPSQLKDVQDFSSLGKSFLQMLSSNLSEDLETLQIITSIGYLCLSKAIQNEPHNLNCIKDRLLVLRFGRESFQYTVMSALGIGSNPFSNMLSITESQVEKAISSMEIADLIMYPSICRQFSFFQQRLNELEQMIENNLFLSDQTIDKIVHSGTKNHERLIEYLENKVMIDGEVDF